MGRIYVPLRISHGANIDPACHSSDLIRPAFGDQARKNVELIIKASVAKRRSHSI